MKKTILSLFLSLTVFVSCKFTELPTGTYTGQYGKNVIDTTQSLPVPSGNGTLKLTDNGNYTLNAVFTSAGNPDIYMTNLSVHRYKYGFSTNSFEIQGMGFGGTNYYSGIYGGVTEDSYETYISISKYDTLGFTFEGTRQ